MAKKQNAPDINTDGTMFTILSWVMGVLSILASSVFVFFFSGPHGGGLDLTLAILYLLAANLIIPPVRRHWMRVTGIRLFGKRLIYIYFGMFTAIMGVGYINELSKQQEAFGPKEKAKITITKTPADTVLAPVKDGLFWGYVNTNGKLVIPADAYDEAGPFIAGAARVKQGGETFYINFRNEKIDAPNGKAKAVNLKLTPKQLNGLWGWQDSTGRWQIPAKFDKIGKWGYTYSTISSTVKPPAE